MSDQPGVSQRAATIAFTLGCLLFAFAFVQRVAPSIITTELMRDFAVGGAALGSLSAFYFWTYAGIQLPVGILTDRFGPRKLMSFTALICAFATVGFAMSETLFVASFWRAIIGGSVAFAFVGTMAIAGYWFAHSRHAMLAGFLQAIGMFGAVFAQAPLRAVVEALEWRPTMYVLAVVAVALSVLLYLFIPKRSEEQRVHHEPAGLLDGLKDVAANRQSWLCALIGFGFAAPMLSFSGLWAVPWFSTVHGYSATQAAGLASVLFLGWAVTSPFVGWFSDRIGRRNLIMKVGGAVYIVMLAIMFYATPSQTWLVVVLIFLAGSAGSSMTVSFVAMKEHNNPVYASTSVSLLNMFVVGSGAVMQPTIGWLLDRNWDGTVVAGARIYGADAYDIAFASLLVVIIIAFVLTFVFRETRCKQVG